MEGTSTMTPERSAASPDGDPSAKAVRDVLRAMEHSHALAYNTPQYRISLVTPHTGMEASTRARPEPRRRSKSARARASRRKKTSRTFFYTSIRAPCIMSRHYTTPYSRTPDQPEDRDRDGPRTTGLDRWSRYPYLGPTAPSLFRASGPGAPITDV
ncbi:hypothetical protein BC834DRAFT_41366 [Gloeopeniophorella convolvens]|nr:hypothetical protein BC834DRAFT_41366 [Gloeopeniophorella convolvens]